MSIPARKEFFAAVKTKRKMTANEKMIGGVVTMGYAAFGFSIGLVAVPAIFGLVGLVLLVDGFLRPEG